MNPLRWHINHRHLRAGVVVDTNLLLLLLVGRYDITKLSTFRATQKYTPYIFEALEGLISLFKLVYSTTNIITETDNLSRQVAKNEWEGIGESLQRFVRRNIEETFPTTRLVGNDAHRRIGITDCSIIELARRNVLVVTDDLTLTVEIERQRLSVINLSRYLRF